MLSAYRNTSILIGLGFRHELKREKNKSSFTRDNIAKKNFWTGNIGIKQDFDSVFVELIYKQVLTKNHSDYFYNSTIDSWILRIGYYFDLKKT